MPANRDTQNGPDWKDIASVMNSFAEDLDARVVITLSRKGTGDAAVIRMEAEAHPYVSTPMDPRRSVSRSVTYVHSGCGMGVAAMYRLLLELDFAASQEWAQKIVKRR